MTDDTLYTKCPACGGTGEQRGSGGSVGLGACGVCDGERYVPVGVSRDEVKAARDSLDLNYPGDVSLVPSIALVEARELLAKLGDDDAS